MTVKVEFSLSKAPKHARIRSGNGTGHFMKRNLVGLLEKFSCPSVVRINIAPESREEYFSQFGQDVFLDRLFGEKMACLLTLVLTTELHFPTPTSSSARDGKVCVLKPIQEVSSPDLNSVNVGW